MKYALQILSALFFFAALAAVGSMDAADAQAEADFYSEMVCAGHWPDYDNRKPNCEEGN